MSTWRLCDKWDLEVDLKQAAATKKDHRAYHEFSAAAMGRRLVCRERLIASLPPLRTVRELFGGLGLTSTIVRNVHHPQWHRVTDIDPDLVAHLRRNHFDAGQEDAFRAVGRLRKSWDLVDADFGLFTVLRWYRNAELQDFMKSLFGGGHRYVIVTDHAVSRFGAHRDKYASILDALVSTLEEYVNAWSQRFWREYGYSVLRAEHHRGSTYTVWSAEPPQPVVPNKTKVDYEGVRILDAEGSLGGAQKPLEALA